MEQSDRLKVVKPGFTSSIGQWIKQQGWAIITTAIALLVATPIIFVFLNARVDAREIWSHLWATVLPEYLINSFALMLGVGSGVLIVGVGTAWLVTVCRFWGCRWFEWLLLLPLAAPAYILAYTYTNVLDYWGPVQTALRQLTGWTSAADYWFPSIRNLWGAILMLILVLYPYVYLLARVAFLEQSTCTLEASRILGSNPWQSFFRVALPLARPAIVAGLALAEMETLNDFGTVKYFGVNTFTTGIYRTWSGMGQPAAASQLASVLMLFMFVLLAVERWSRRQSRYYQPGSQQPFSPYQLRGIRAVGAWGACLLPLAFGFIIPIGFLVKMSLDYQEQWRSELWELSAHSLILAVVTGAIALACSVLMAYALRLNHNWGIRLTVRIAAFGYAIPGSVIAVGILIALGTVDRSLINPIFGWLLSGTVFSLVYAYLVRFLAVAFGAVESSLSKINPNLDDAARSLGYSPTGTLIKVHAPLMGGGLLTAAMLVFVDVMKELPATIVIRPFNFDTLAIRVYYYAADERLREAAAPALLIVLVGILPVIALSRKIAQSRQF